MSKGAVCRDCEALLADIVNKTSEQCHRDLLSRLLAAPQFTTYHCLDSSTAGAQKIQFSKKGSVGKLPRTHQSFYNEGVVAPSEQVIDLAIQTRKQALCER